MIGIGTPRSQSRIGMTGSSCYVPFPNVSGSPKFALQAIRSMDSGIASHSFMHACISRNFEDPATLPRQARRVRHACRRGSCHY